MCLRIETFSGSLRQRENDNCIVSCFLLVILWASCAADFLCCGLFYCRLLVLWPFLLQTSCAVVFSTADFLCCGLFYCRLLVLWSFLLRTSCAVVFSTADFLCCGLFYCGLLVLWPFLLQTSCAASVLMVSVCAATNISV